MKTRRLGGAAAEKCGCCSGDWGSRPCSNPMIAAARQEEEEGDATQAHRSAPRVAAADSCFPRSGWGRLQDCGDRKGCRLEEEVAQGTFRTVGAQGFNEMSCWGSCGKWSSEERSGTGFWSWMRCKTASSVLCY